MTTSHSLTPDEDGFWFARIPLLKGCMTHGDSREDALTMLDDAKRLWLETALEAGIPIPEPEMRRARHPQLEQTHQNFIRS
jgi:predicted RNase H-like HicB family nuclease